MWISPTCYSPSHIPTYIHAHVCYLYGGMLGAKRISLTTDGFRFFSGSANSEVLRFFPVWCQFSAAGANSIQWHEWAVKEHNGDACVCVAWCLRVCQVCTWIPSYMKSSEWYWATLYQNQLSLIAGHFCLISFGQLHRKLNPCAPRLYNSVFQSYTFKNIHLEFRKSHRCELTTTGKLCFHSIQA